MVFTAIPLLAEVFARGADPMAWIGGVYPASASAVSGCDDHNLTQTGDLYLAFVHDELDRTPEER
jgi:hypothetical protein